MEILQVIDKSNLNSIVDSLNTEVLDNSQFSSMRAALCLLPVMLCRVFFCAKKNSRLYLLRGLVMRPSDET